jgi:hypothetical protein
MEFKGTKGDWKLSSSKSNESYRKITKSDFPVLAINVDGHNGHIMTFGDNDKIHKANAKLIAAAPELLAAAIKGVEPDLYVEIYDSEYSESGVLEANVKLIEAAPKLLAAAIKAIEECCDLIGTDAGNSLEKAINKALN